MDEYLLLLSNSILGHSDKIDHNLLFLTQNQLTKSVPLITCFWIFWFIQKDGEYVYRSRVFASLVIGLAGIVVGRALAVILPFRFRPIHTPDLEITIADGVSRHTLDGWSSMPSDHAVFFAALCACLFFMNRTLAIAISIYSFLIALLPRVIYGLHWPSDIFVGSLVGIAITLILMKPLRLLAERTGFLSTMLRYEAAFYPAMFLLTFQMATGFDTLRSVLDLAARTVVFFVQSI